MLSRLQGLTNLTCRDRIKFEQLVILNCARARSGEVSTGRRRSLSLGVFPRRKSRRRFTLQRIKAPLVYLLNGIVYYSQRNARLYALFSPRVGDKRVRSAKGCVARAWRRAVGNILENLIRENSLSLSLDIGRRKYVEFFLSYIGARKHAHTQSRRGMKNRRVSFARAPRTLRSASPAYD